MYCLSAAKFTIARKIAVSERIVPFLAGVASRTVPSDCLRPLFFAILLSPEGVSVPFVLPDMGNLNVSDVRNEVEPDIPIDNLPAFHGDLACLRQALVKIGVFLGE